MPLFMLKKVADRDLPGVRIVVASAAAWQGYRRARRASSTSLSTTVAVIVLVTLPIRMCKSGSIAVCAAVAHPKAAVEVPVSGRSRRSWHLGWSVHSSSR